MTDTKRGALNGAFFGGVIEGFASGFDAVKHGGSFWNGDQYTLYYNDAVNPNNFLGDPKPVNDRSIAESINKNSYYTDNNMVYHASHDQPQDLLGKWKYDRTLNKGVITIYRDAFKREELLDLVVGHEIMHHKFNVYYDKFRFEDWQRWTWSEEDPILKWMDERYMSRGLNRLISPWRNRINWGNTLGSPVTNPFK